MLPFSGCVMRVRLFVFILALTITPLSSYFSLYLSQFLLIHYVQNRVPIRTPCSSGISSHNVEDQ